MVFSLPVLASLKLQFPSAKIVSILRKPCLPIWQSAGIGDEFLVRQSGTSIRSFRQLLKALRKRRPDFAIVLPQSHQPVILAKFSGAAVRAGFHPSPLERWLTCTVPKNTPPSVFNNLALLESLGIRPRKRDYVGLLHPVEGEVVRMRTRLAEMGVPSYARLIVLSPGANISGSVKEWTPEGFAAVADHYATQPDTAVVFIGTTPVDDILKLCQFGKVHDLTCKTTLHELIALLARADLFIGIDSGALHIAAATGTPVVGLYGASDWENTGPMGIGHRIVRHPVECSPCLAESCAIGRICMTRIQPGLVIEAADSALDELQDNQTMLRPID